MVVSLEKQAKETNSKRITMAAGLGGSVNKKCVHNCSKSSRQLCLPRREPPPTSNLFAMRTCAVLLLLPLAAATCKVFPDTDFAGHDLTETDENTPGVSATARRYTLVPNAVQYKQTRSLTPPAPAMAIYCV